MLQKRGDRARQRERGSIEGMHEARLLSASAPIADAAATRLEIGERAAGRHLEPRAYARRPHFQIVRLGAGEPGVAGREDLHAIRESEQLQDLLGVRREKLELSRR